jgi:predicted RNase H-like HicB family nuclease
MAQVKEQTTTSGETQAAVMKVERGLNFYSVDRDLIGDRAEFAGHLPEHLFNRYIDGAIKRVEPKRLEDDAWFVEIPGFDGVWASGPDLPSALTELREVLSDWVLLKIIHKDRDLPIIEPTINLNIIG